MIFRVLSLKREHTLPYLAMENGNTIINAGYTSELANGQEGVIADAIFGVTKGDQHSPLAEQIEEFVQKRQSENIQDGVK